MTECHLNILEFGPDAWTAELWSGFPGSSEGRKLAGNGQPYNLTQLERDGLHKATVRSKIETQDLPDDAFLMVGMRLYELFEATGVAQEWTRLRTAAETPTAGAAPGLRTYLEVPDSLTEWPWELLAWRIGPNLYQRGFNSDLHPILRVARPFRPLGVTDGTLRILLVSGQEDLGNHYKASDELRLIRRIFHNAGLSVLVELCAAPETTVTLQTKIDALQPHILHFIGHGLMHGAEYALQVLKPPAAPTWWPTGLIGQYFASRIWKPRLVLLNACHGGQTQQTAASIADALLAAGIPAVIAAQAALRVDYAKLFAIAFYGALTRRRETDRLLDKAMGAARTRLSVEARFQALNGRHWALPVLKVSAPVEQILQFQPVNREVMNCIVVKDIFARPGRFVNRTTDRWSLLSKFAPALSSDPIYRGVILKGTSDLGKSWLVKRSIRDFLDSGFLVRYAMLNGPQARRTSLDVLEDWRGRGALTTFLLRPWSAPHFDEFDRYLQDAHANPTAAAAQMTFAAFKKGLQTARAGKKVILILDRFRYKDNATVSKEDFREGLLEQLLFPIQRTPADADVDGICALLIVRDHPQVNSGLISDFDEYGLEMLSGFETCPIPPFERDQLDNIWDEFSDFTKNDGMSALRSYMESIVKASPTWKPKALEVIEPAVVNAQQLPGEGGEIDV